MNLQAQLASLKEQAAQSFSNGSGATSYNNTSPNNYDHHDQKASSSYGKIMSTSNSPQDFQSWFHQSENSSVMPQFDNLKINANIGSFSDQNEMMNCGNNYGMNEVHNLHEENNVSYSKYSMDSVQDMQMNNNNQWSYRDDIDDLQSVAFGYYQH